MVLYRSLSPSNTFHNRTTQLTGQPLKKLQVKILKKNAFFRLKFHIFGDVSKNWFSCNFGSKIWFNQWTQKAKKKQNSFQCATIASPRACIWNNSGTENELDLIFTIFYSILPIFTRFDPFLPEIYAFLVPRCNDSWAIGSLYELARSSSSSLVQKPSCQIPKNAKSKWRNPEWSAQSLSTIK